MSFYSIFFLFLFLPVFLLIYYVVPPKLQNIVLIIGSLLFYTWGDPAHLPLLLLSCLFHYYIGLELDRLRGNSTWKKYTLIFAIVIDLFLLGFFKYIGFAAETIGAITKHTFSYPKLALPLGLSFYTFRNLSYLFDIYKGKLRPQRNILLFAVYSLMFPHITSGPIIRYREVAKELRMRKLHFGKLGIGGEMFIKGLAKKVLLADNLALIYQGISNANNGNSVVSAWLCVLAFTLQLYFDFSGYSDMAIGLAKMLGFNFSKNFDYPYTSLSITEFWRRWHISLGSWFRDYAYIPLGGNRQGIPRQILNLLIVWLLTGLWHGADWNFVLWGLYYGILLIIEKFLLNKVLPLLPKPARIAYTMFFVMIGWALFSHTGLSSTLRFTASLFGIGANGIIDSTALYYLRTGILTLIISILCCSRLPYQHFKKLMSKRPDTAILLNIGLLILCIAYMIFSTYSPFLYTKF